MSGRHRNLTLIAALALAVACGRSEPEAPAMPDAAETAAPSVTAADIAARLEAASRSEEDRARDTGRKPAEVLAFLGIEPGMDVIDLMAAGGWYSEVLSAAVGPDGSVAAHNPPWMLAFRDGFYGNALDERLAGNRLPNVTRVDLEFASIGADGTQYDAALSALNFHDAYYLVSPEAAATLLSSVYAALKPGGVFGVIDHAGNPDGDNRSLHRIDKAIVVRLAEEAGFVIDGDSDLLANPADDHTVGVFSEGIRGNTDRFLLKLRKPAD
mgnify:CR=1 FL=1